MLARILFWRRPRVAVVELHGLIAARAGMLSAASAAPLINRAFSESCEAAAGDPRHRKPSAGSPVQSDLIASLIRRRAGGA